MLILNDLAESNGEMIDEEQPPREKSEKSVAKNKYIGLKNFIYRWKVGNTHPFQIICVLIQKDDLFLIKLIFIP